MAKQIASLFHFHFKLWNIEVIEYYLHVTLMQIGKSMTNLFIPIYLLSDLNFKIWQVLFFYVLWQLAFVPSVIFAGTIIGKLGLKRTMVFALPFHALFFWALNGMRTDFWPAILWITPFILLQASTQAMANVANDIFMAKHVLVKKSGTMLAWLRVLMTFGTLLAPLIGGLVTYFFSFDALFVAAMVIVVVSGLPLLLASDHHFKINYKPSSLIKFLKKKAQPDYLTAEFGNIFTDTVMWILWPIFLYFVLDSTAEMGVLVTVSAVLSILVSYFIGKKIKDIEPHKMIKRGVKIASFLFFARPLFLHPVAIGVIDSVYKIIDPIFRIPYDQAAYRLVMKNQNLVQRANVKQLVAEIYFTCTTILLFVFSLFFAEFSKGFFVSIFLVSALIMLLMQRMAHVKFTFVDKIMIKKEAEQGLVEKSVKILERGEF